MSAITPDLHGDLKCGQESFLLTPVSRSDLADLRSSRNFWVRINPEKIWSVTGVSKDIRQIKQDQFSLEAGMLWQKINRQNKPVGLKAEILSFVPATSQALEVLQIKLTNISNKKIICRPTAAIPIFGRGANNLRDHRQVTSLLQRIILHKFGVICFPTLSFDETGHHANRKKYFVLGWDEFGLPPERIYPTQEIFCGDAGDLEWPEAVLKDIPQEAHNIQGKEAIGGLAFKSITLAPRQSKTYIVVMGISEDPAEINKAIVRFRNPSRVGAALKETQNFWSGISQGIEVSTGDSNFDNWLRWVNIQPHLRKIYGCSFLPDFDYGRGGRGWRDLWQDCLGLILSDPYQVRELLINNFYGVKIDGSNATIILKSLPKAKAPFQKSALFVADRNNISRVWMDHGIWPLLTLDLYIHETGDLNILFEEAAYFRNHEIKRAQEIDYSWTPAEGNQLRTSSGKVYQGSILEHLLVQHLVQFFNVGSHNHIRLEGADWNDGLDMAKENGESVAFTALYAQNLLTLSELLLKTGKKNIIVAAEIQILLKRINYDSIPAKRRLLERYFAQTSAFVSGRKASLDTGKLAEDLRAKSDWIKRHIRDKEWLKEGFFNGYYDNHKRRLEGKTGRLLRMTLTGQTFPVMAGLAYDWQVRKLLQNVNRYLKDRQNGGIRLNTDFFHAPGQRSSATAREAGEKGLFDMGRAFSFSYGDKENGAVFSHMDVMFSYALYKQGYARQGWDVLRSLYEMAINTQKSKIYPCLPEYFNLQGQGMYSYLTGSASWFMLTMLTQVFGVKGQDGDLLIEPKLDADNFRKSDNISISRFFAGKRIKIQFFNPAKLKHGGYRIAKVRINAQNIPIDRSRYLVITREVILGLSSRKLNIIEVYLG